MKNSQTFGRLFGDVRRHPWLHVFSVGTVAAALVILGLFFLGYRNLSELTRSALGPSLAMIFVKADAAPADRKALDEKLRSLPDVKSVRFRGSEAVRTELSALLGDLPSGPGKEADLVPELFELELTKPITARESVKIRAELEAMSAVDEIDFSDRWAAQHRKLQQFLGLFAFLFVTVIAVGCALLIANFMGLRHQARRNEIDVLRLFGGNRGFIFAPYFWEGLVEGLLGAGAALTVLWMVQSLLSAYIRVKWASVLGFDRWLYLSPVQVALIILIGVGTASVGSLSVFLRIRKEAR